MNVFETNSYILFVIFTILIAQKALFGAIHTFWVLFLFICFYISIKIHIYIYYNNNNYYYYNTFILLQYFFNINFVIFSNVLLFLFIYKCKNCFN